MDAHMTQVAEQARAVQTDIPGRLDRLPWGVFHWLLVTALGVTWLLDGLEATVVASIAPILQEPASGLGLRATQIGLAGTIYLAGAILGALVFGYLTDRLGRKRLFTVTLAVYLVGAALSALAWSFWSFVLFRFITGMAIGGEYSAINSAVDELVPARVRGRVDLAINGSYWIGAILGAGCSIVALNLLPAWLGWRVLFALGAVVGVGMIIARRYVPESPRWLMSHGRAQEADEIMTSIEARVHAVPPAHNLPHITIYPDARRGFSGMLSETLRLYKSRALLGLVLIASQAFFYNGISFTYPLVLHQYFGVPAEDVGVYVLLLAIPNFLGPLLLGSLFDTVGRRCMISATYTISGILIMVTQFLFLRGQLTAITQTWLWGISFFFASAAASSGYLTVSEVFPLEMRALAIAFFYALGTAIGGLGAPAAFGALLETGQPEMLFYGYLFGALLMIFAAIVELILGVDAEQRALEEVAAPLSTIPWIGRR
jgi:MFS family permease